MYYVYILECSDKTLYTGITTDIHRRLKEHNGELPGGAKYTAARNPVTLLYSEIFPNRSEASIEESRIKKLTRTQKEALIEILHNVDNKDGRYKEDIEIGAEVNIILKQDQRTGELTNGIVAKILTNSSQHPYGIKVMLNDGQVGRVQEIL